ncbi:MAG: Hpt domain-containing protein [Alphaproteobacteria bacterium]|nr:Hpt domain-containing protein [Alphaproteobacteria bacterium]
MTQVDIDLSNLKMAADGDKELERELFEEFIESSTELLSVLKKNAQIDNKNNHETWQKNAHALKGISSNLGAYTLADLCKQAQELLPDSLDTKTALLDKIQKEHESVVAYLNVQKN